MQASSQQQNLPWSCCECVLLARYGDNVNCSSSVTHAALSVSIRQTGVLGVSFAIVVDSVGISLEIAILPGKCFAIGGVRSAIRRDITLSTAHYNGGYISTAHPRNAMLNLSVAKLSRCSSTTMQPTSQSILKHISHLIPTATIAPRRVI